jgi:hypothetical protein
VCSSELVKIKITQAEAYATEKQRMGRAINGTFLDFQKAAGVEKK